MRRLDADLAMFLSRVPEPLYQRLAERATLGAELDAMWQRAREQWPDLAVERGELFAYVADRLAADAADDVIEHLHAADLLLACACYRGDGAAIGACERANRPSIDRGFDSLGASESLRDEAMQSLRERLFVGSAEQPPAIGSFSGRGSLRKWLRVAATRAAISITRKHKREVGLEHAPDLPDAADDLELGHLKRTYQAAFKEAFAEALATLTPKQRGLLRMSVLDKLSIDAIGSVEGVHRATAARWLREAREDLAIKTRALLRERLQIGGGELESIMRLIRSRLDISLTRQLKPDRA